jgi:type II secretory ATPase GspE/PulE/Tfp pilus assembly ATPase PilB-like protein
MTDHSMNQKLSHILYEYGMMSVENSLLAESRNHTVKNNRHDEQPDEPVIQFVNQLLKHAVQQAVSDIHLESLKDCCRVRFRCDGLLFENAVLPLAFAGRVMTRIKIMANLDIAEKRLPQDGRLMFQPLALDFRVSTCPSLHGEKIVLRLLRHQLHQLSLSECGMSLRQQQQFLRALAEPQGLIIVTGPTGCGKTATLYSALQSLSHEEKNIMTVEDPVEIEMAGLTQVNVNPRIGLSFANLLRSFLRQDPDILLVGEIRDAETAAIAVQAAQTGHLVLTTMHTNHALDSLQRLVSLGIKLPQLAGSLLLLAAQRLVRKICVRCKQHGCADCRGGYAGR